MVKGVAAPDDISKGYHVHFLPFFGDRLPEVQLFHIIVATVG